MLTFLPITQPRSLGLHQKLNSFTDCNWTAKNTPFGRYCDHCSTLHLPLSWPDLPCASCLLYSSPQRQWQVHLSLQWSRKLCCLLLTCFALLPKVIVEVYLDSAVTVHPDCRAWRFHLVFSTSGPRPGLTV